MTADGPLVAAVRATLAAAGDPLRAAQQQAYMKSALPYRGLTAPQLRQLLRPVLAEHPLDDRTVWEDTIAELWDGATHREEWYAAIALLRHPAYRAWLDPALLPLLRHLVTIGAWWDVVDELATNPVAEILAGHRDEVDPLLREWAVAADPWLRRTAILSQLKLRGRTDPDLLAFVLDANVAETGFFLRKAIGWALREYARTDPAWVRAFVDSRPLSGLSRREALKHLGTQTGTSSTAPTA